VCVLYLVKINNENYNDDFYGIPYNTASIYPTPHFIAPNLLPQNSPDLIPVEYVKSEESCPISTISQYWTLLIWTSEVASDCCMVDGLACSNMSSTRQLTSGVECGRLCGVRLCKNWWATLGSFALIIYMNSLLRITVNVTWFVIWCNNLTFVWRLRIWRCTDSTLCLWRNC